MQSMNYNYIYWCSSTKKYRRPVNFLTGIDIEDEDQIRKSGRCFRAYSRLWMTLLNIRGFKIELAYNLQAYIRSLSQSNQSGRFQQMAPYIAE